MLPLPTMQTLLHKSTTYELKSNFAYWLYTVYTHLQGNESQALHQFQFKPRLHIFIPIHFLFATYFPTSHGRVNIHPLF